MCLSVKESKKYLKQTPFITLSQLIEIKMSFRLCPLSRKVRQKKTKTKEARKYEIEGQRGRKEGGKRTDTT